MRIEIRAGIRVIPHLVLWNAPLREKSRLGVNSGEPSVQYTRRPLQCVRSQNRVCSENGPSIARCDGSVLELHRLVAGEAGSEPVLAQVLTHFGAPTELENDAIRGLGH